MPAAAGEHSSHSSLSIPNSTDGGTSNGSATPTTGQSAPSMMGTAPDSTLALDGDRETQVGPDLLLNHAQECLISPFAWIDTDAL